ncbi:MAG: hypothetical protein RLZZ621_1299 [Gemmatimonadota bacterium]|jgi:transcriptional regulator PpsR
MSVKRARATDPALGALDPSLAASLLASAGDLAVVLDADGVVHQVLVSGDSTPLSEASTLWPGRYWPDTATSETRSKMETLTKEATLHGVSKRRQVNHHIGDASDVPISYVAMRLGKGGHIVAVGRDMRQVAALQQRLVESQQAMERDYWRLRHVETRYRLLFQLANDGILVLDASNMKVLDANQAAAHIFDEPVDRLIGRTFPFGVEPGAVRTVEELIATARSAGRAGDITITMSDGRDHHVSASCFRQESATLLLLRVSPADSGGGNRAPGSSTRLLDLLERSPDAIVVTDLDGSILSANHAFLDMAEMASEDQVRGTSLSAYIGRPGADFPVFISMLRKHAAVRLMATSARGSLGLQSEVEVSAVWSPEGDRPCIAFTIRDIGRRLASGPQGARDLTRAVEELTGLVGRVSLRDLVRDTIDLVERHFIEAALELTNDNRTSAAEVLGVSRQSLYVKLRRHRLVSPDGERDDEGGG